MIFWGIKYEPLSDPPPPPPSPALKFVKGAPGIISYSVDCSKTKNVTNSAFTARRNKTSLIVGCVNHDSANIKLESHDYSVARLQKS